MKTFPLFAFIGLIFTPPALLAEVATQPKSPGIESRDYVWNEVQDESLLALRATANSQRGAATYKLCHGCHKAGGLGDSGGGVPRLAGQHDTVLIKQLIDIRKGRRDNPTMYPFANEREVSTQDVADLSVYLSGLAAPPDNVKGSGSTDSLSHGQSLYGKDCASCHGKNGEGMAGKFYPKLAGQHFPYLSKQISDIASGARRNASPKMVKIVKRYSSKDIAAVADFLSRQPRAGTR